MGPDTEIKTDILSLSNIVLTLVAQTECEIKKIRELFDRLFMMNIELEEFKKAYMYAFVFVPDKNLGSQKLIYRYVQSRLLLQKRKLLIAYKKNIHNTDTEVGKISQSAVIMLELLPDMV